MARRQIVRSNIGEPGLSAVAAPVDLSVQFPNYQQGAGPAFDLGAVASIFKNAGGLIERKVQEQQDYEEQRAKKQALEVYTQYGEKLQDQKAMDELVRQGLIPEAGTLKFQKHLASLLGSANAQDFEAMVRADPEFEKSKHPGGVASAPGDLTPIMERASKQIEGRWALHNEYGRVSFQLARADVVARLRGEVNRARANEQAELSHTLQERKYAESVQAFAQVPSPSPAHIQAFAQQLNELHAISQGFGTLEAPALERNGLALGLASLNNPTKAHEILSVMRSEGFKVGGARIDADPETGKLFGALDDKYVKEAMQDRALRAQDRNLREIEAKDALDKALHFEALSMIEGGATDDQVRQAIIDPYLSTIPEGNQDLMVDLSEYAQTKLNHFREGLQRRRYFDRAERDDRYESFLRRVESGERLKSFATDIDLEGLDPKQARDLLAREADVQAGVARLSATTYKSDLGEIFSSVKGRFPLETPDHVWARSVIDSEATDLRGAIEREWLEYSKPFEDENGARRIRTPIEIQQHINETKDGYKKLLDARVDAYDKASSGAVKEIRDRLDFRLPITEKELTPDRLRVLSPKFLEDSINESKKIADPMSDFGDVIQGTRVPTLEHYESMIARLISEKKRQGAPKEVAIGDEATSEEMAAATALFQDNYSISALEIRGKRDATSSLGKSLKIAADQAARDAAAGRSGGAKGEAAGPKTPAQAAAEKLAKETGENATPIGRAKANAKAMLDESNTIQDRERAASGYVREWSKLIPEAKSQIESYAEWMDHGRPSFFQSIFPDTRSRADAERMMLAAAHEIANSAPIITPRGLRQPLLVQQNPASNAKAVKLLSMAGVLKPADYERGSYTIQPDENLAKALRARFANEVPQWAGKRYSTEADQYVAQRLTPVTLDLNVPMDPMMSDYGFTPKEIEARIVDKSINEFLKLPSVGLTEADIDVFQRAQLARGRQNRRYE